MEPKLSLGSFYGTPQKSRAVEGLVMTEHAYPPHLRIPRHAHECAYFCLVLQGSYTETYGQRNRTCEPMTVVFHPEAETHSDRFAATGGRLFCIEASSQWLTRIRAYTPLLDVALDLQGGAPSWLALRLYREFQETDSVSPLAMEGLTLEILAEASRRALHSTADRRPPVWLRQTCDLLHARFAESLTLEEIAQTASVHPMHLARAFRQYYRCTIGEYVRQLRVEFACREMTTTETPLLEIALTAGFSDQSQFTKTFKRHTGLTPSAFRQTTRSC